jgi:hypothetical protein
MPIYDVSTRGQLFGLAFQQRGDPIAGTAITSLRLNFGNLQTTLQKAGKEPGVHVGVTIGNASYPADKSLDYARLTPTTTPSDEARRLIHLMKIKETPSTTDYNNSMVPIMAVSETDRSQIGGLLTMTELYNIKYGSSTFDQAFVNSGDPHFVGAKKRGGAKALKHIDRERRKTAIGKSQRMTGKQRARLHASVSTFVRHLSGARGRGRPSKFLAAASKADVLNQVVTTLVRRAGYR